MHRAESDKVFRHFIERTKLGWRHRWTLYLSTAAVWITGAVWLYLHYFAKRSDALGEIGNPAEPLWLKLHGAFAMAFMIVIGTLIPGHMRRAWVLKRNRLSGALLNLLSFLLISSGWGLYYIADETWRAHISQFHWIAGLVLPLGIFFHILAWKLSQS